MGQKRPGLKLLDEVADKWRHISEQEIEYYYLAFKQSGLKGLEGFTDEEELNITVTSLRSKLRLLKNDDKASAEKFERALDVLDYFSEHLLGLLTENLVASWEVKSAQPPRLGERILLLVLRTKEERVNIPGDLEEEYRVIAAKHGRRYAKLWYYKQVISSAWPLLKKALRWGVFASAWELVRRLM